MDATSSPIDAPAETDAPRPAPARPKSLLQIERDLALALSAAADLPMTLRCVLSAARQIAGIDCGGVYLVDETTGNLDLIYTEALPSEFVASALHYAADAPNAQLIMAGRAFYTHLSEFSPFMDDVRRREGLRAIVILPIQYEGRSIAALNLGSHSADEIPAAGRAALEVIAAQLGEVIARIKAETALRENQRNLQTLFDSVEDPIIVLDAAGHLCHFNSAVLRRFGYTPEELLAAGGLNIRPAQTRRAIRVALAGLAAGPTALRTISIMAKDGTLIPLECRMSRGEWNGRPAFVIVASDVSERRRAEDQRLEMERRLLHAQKLESLGVLAGGIAHDFNNLLGAILGNLDLAMLDLPSYSPARESVQEATDAAVRAAALTRQMLAYSGKGSFVVEAVNLSDVVSEMTRLLKVSISKNATLRLSLDHALPRIEADPTQIQQVIMNLITNASEAIGERMGVISITTGLQEVGDDLLLRSRLDSRPPAGQYVYLEVADTGCGMDLPTLQRLFDPFFTTKVTGRGLGMSSVLGIVRGHHGAILVDSDMGAGTKITVFFPMAGVDRLAPAGPRTGQTPLWRNGARAPMGAVLVVDDDVAMRRLCSAMVERLGFRVVPAGDGEEAVAIYRQRSTEIACVILDLTMPRLGGAAALDQLREIRPDVKVILSSGYPQAEIMPQFAGKGLAGYIEKPYQLAVLHAELERALGA